MYHPKRFENLLCERLKEIIRNSFYRTTQSSDPNPQTLNTMGIKYGLFTVLLLQYLQNKYDSPLSFHVNSSWSETLSTWASLHTHDIYFDTQIIYICKSTHIFLTNRFSDMTIIYTIFFSRFYIYLQLTSDVEHTLLQFQHKNSKPYLRAMSNVIQIFAMRVRIWMKVFLFKWQSTSSLQYFALI